MKRYPLTGTAYLSGIFIGMDPIGTILGYITKNKSFVGYCADKKLEEDTIKIFNDKPNLLEHLCKGIGCCSGLLTNLCLFLPQIMFLELKRELSKI